MLPWLRIVALLLLSITAVTAIDVKLVRPNPYLLLSKAIIHKILIQLTKANALLDQQGGSKMLGHVQQEVMGRQG